MRSIGVEVEAHTALATLARAGRAYTIYHCHVSKLYDVDKTHAMRVQRDVPASSPSAAAVAVGLVGALTFSAGFSGFLPRVRSLCAAASGAAAYRGSPAKVSFGYGAPRFASLSPYAP